MPILMTNGQTYTAPTNKKADPPKTGNAFGAWAGRELETMTLPGGGVVQFDLSQLTTQDFRNMRDHYQVNASLAVLSFMQHQSDFHIECEDKRIADFCEEQIRNNWTGINRTMGTANWAGYAPAALNWENEGRNITLDKVKDLIPEECAVHWDLVEGWAPPNQVKPKFKQYGGIKQLGTPWPIPVENTLWYPLLMENGDYYGRKLLRPAFTSWFFSIIVHLFANRYFERFGEPVPVGRAPFDETVDIDGTEVRGNQYLLKVLQDLRNRSVVVLPNDRTENSNGQSSFDYEIEYLESQMRGADFERYLTRLDEEISIGLFTPILLLRTADVGSYNLGQGHMQVYLWMLNAMNDDRKVYIDKYLLSKMTDYNFGPRAPRPKIVFRKMGNTDASTVKEMLNELVRSGKAMPDLNELGEIAGLTMNEIKQTVEDPAAPAADPDPAPDDPQDRVEVARPRRPAAATGHVIAVHKEIVDRVRKQVENAISKGGLNAETTISMGFKRRMSAAFEAEGYKNAASRTGELYDAMDQYVASLLDFGDEFSEADSFMSLFENELGSRVVGLGVMDMASHA